MKNFFTSRECAVSALNVSLLIISAQLYIPISPPVTLQLMALFFICGYFSFKISLVSVWAYLIGGSLGLPFFSGFQGGATALLGPTGGFIMAFGVLPFIFLAIKPTNLKNIILDYTLSLIICYLMGGFWLKFYINAQLKTFISFLIFIPLDVCKAVIAIILIIKLKKIMK